MDKLQNRLAEFTATHKIRGKGALGVMLVITRKASQLSIPLSSDNFLAPKQGQVAGLGRNAVQAILKDYGITRVLAEEGGRTSRGSIQLMRDYVAFLNALHAEGLLDFTKLERWWADRVQDFFAAKPLKFKVDAAKSLRSLVADLLETAFKRQREHPGTMVAGAVMQHLVGAKLELVLSCEAIHHHGFSVADAPSDRQGDFLVDNTAIHVTTAPSPALMNKCEKNLAMNLRPVIVTTQEGAGGAWALANNVGIAERIEILEVEQFVAANILERCGFQQARRQATVEELIVVYNRIIDECETDPSLTIKVG